MEREEPFFERVRLTWPGKDEEPAEEVTEERPEEIRRESEAWAERQGIRMKYRTEEEIANNVWPGHAGRGGSLWKKKV